MTQNSLSVIASTPVGGLGTQTYNILTTGNYTASFTSFLPYLAAGSPPQTTQMANEIQNITAVADTSGSLNSTYFTFYSAANLYGFYVWYNINSAGVDPAPTGLIGIEVSAATGVTAANVATDTISAINANANAASAGVVASAGASTHLILTNTYYGACTAAANSSAASPGFSYAITQAGSFGSPAASGLTVVISDGATVLGRWGNPSPTQPTLGGAVEFAATAGDVVTFVLASLSTADVGTPGPKSILNLYAGPAV